MTSWMTVASLATALAGGHAADPHEPQRGAHEPAAHAWSYHGDDGPRRWGALAAEYATCDTGREQSPIALTPDAPRDPVEPLTLRYRRDRATVVNNGHTVEARFADGGGIVLGGTAYAFRQVHFHAPGEHTIDGRRAPVELHFVHEAKDGTLAVLGLNVRRGARDPGYASLLRDLPLTEGASNRQPSASPAALLPANVATAARIAYPGSLTTPPCTEGVRWNVLAEPITLSRGQIARFRAAYTGNRRPLQDRHGRVPASGPPPVR